MKEPCIDTLEKLDFVADESSRKRHLTKKAGDSSEKSRITGLPKEEGLYPVISVDPKYLLYNVDNTRARSFFQDENQEYDPDKVDELIHGIYEKMNDQQIQYQLHKFLFEQAQIADFNIYEELLSGNQGDYLEIDASGIVIDGNRRLAAIREVICEGEIEAKDKLETVKCILITDSTGASSRKRNKQTCKNYY